MPLTHNVFARLPSIFLTLTVLACGSAEPGSRPNIVLVTFDTLRRDHVGTYAEGRGHTPYLDEFARGALIHDNAFTTMPTTGPAHASLFTGLHPYQHGVLQNGMRLGDGLASNRSLPQKLREEGYATAAFVTSPVFGPHRMGVQGLDVFDAPQRPLRSGTDAVDAALKWLDGKRRGPVFLWVHLFDPHSPYGSPEEKQRSYPVEFSSYGWVDRSHYADERSRTRMAEMYARGVRDADAAFGRLWAGVQDRVRTAPTTIVAVADHGEFLDERLHSDGFAYGHGSILDEPVLRIPLMIAGAGVRPGRSTGAVSIRELYTTILETAGVRDADAETEDRRDLRASYSERRFVSAERRSFQRNDHSRRQFAPEVLEQIRGHAVAVTDGVELVVIGEDGSPTVSTESQGAELVAAGRLRLAARQGRTASSDELDIDEATRQSLRSLGYIE